MKKILAFLSTTAVIALFATSAYGFPGSTNTATVAFTNPPSGNFDDWNWKIGSSDDSTFVVTVSDGSPTTNYQWQVAIAGPTGIVQTIYNTNITASSSTTVTFSLFRTNMVDAGSYRTELRAFTGSTNVSAVAGQGRLTVLKSLF